MISGCLYYWNTSDNANNMDHQYKEIFDCQVVYFDQYGTNIGSEFAEYLCGVTENTPEVIPYDINQYGTNEGIAY